MASKGTQSTFILPPEPQGDHPLTTKLVRGGPKDRKERVTIFYHRSYKAFALTYSHNSLGLVYQVAETTSINDLTTKLNDMGFVKL